MRLRKKELTQIIFLLVLALFFVFAFFSYDSVSYVSAYIGENYFLSVFVFVGLTFLATVIAPLAVLPVITPLASVFFGPFQTGLFAVLGWGLGAVVAFLIARHVGRPLLKKAVDIEQVDAYRKYIPEHTEFMWLIVLRIIFTVDLVSYAAGLFSRISLFKYTIATIIGITPLSFVLAYGGGAFLTKDYQTLLIASGIGVAIFLVAGVVYYTRRNRE